MMQRPELSKETIEKIGRGYRFFKILSKAEGTKMASDHIKDYFNQFFKDAMADILQGNGNFERFQEIEKDLLEKMQRDDAILKEMETLSGVQILFLDHLKDSVSVNMRETLRASIRAIEDEIKNDVKDIPDEKAAEYARRQAENLFALEDIVMQDVVKSFKEQGLEGLVIGVGLHGGLKRFDI
ncbi:hypothetical protein ACSU64_27720 [Bacillaceae bacterium C204]|uniref:hypothetical protein n=1 Tax=Neobacillus sp. 204 TaxID=3383351 RepID=UPI00397BCF50